jgi:hypothetical protein
MGGEKFDRRLDSKLMSRNRNQMKRLLALVLAVAPAIPTAQAAQAVYSHHYSNTSNVTAAAPTGIGTTGAVMGLGGTITPLYTGTVLFMISGDIVNNTSSDGGSVQIYYGTGSASVNGTACASAGTTRNAVGQAAQSKLGTAKAPFAVQAVVTGLTVGTTYWYDACLVAITGGTASVGDVTASAAEL